MIRLDFDCTPPAHQSTPPQVATLQVSIEDWDLLFRAVLTRLSLAVNGSPDHALQDRVADCAHALEQLRLSMVENFARCSRGSG